MDLAFSQALLLAVAGAGGLVAQAVVLPLLLRSGAVAGEAGLLRVGLAALEKGSVVAARASSSPPCFTLSLRGSVVAWGVFATPVLLCLETLSFRGYSRTAGVLEKAGL